MRQIWARPFSTECGHKTSTGVSLRFGAGDVLEGLHRRDPFFLSSQLPSYPLSGHFGRRDLCHLHSGPASTRSSHLACTDIGARNRGTINEFRVGHVGSMVILSECPGSEQDRSHAQHGQQLVRVQAGTIWETRCPATTFPERTCSAVCAVSIKSKNQLQSLATYTWSKI